MDKHRLLYPGNIEGTEVVLLTGSIYTGDILLAADALAKGTRSLGYSVSQCVMGQKRPSSSADQVGDPADWDYSYDLMIVVMGEYLGRTNFRYGDLPIACTRTVFFSPVMEPRVAHTVTLPSEVKAHNEVKGALAKWLPKPIHLAKPSLLRQTEVESMMQLTNTEVVRCFEGNEPVPESLSTLRNHLESLRTLSAVPGLERALW